jgi:HK97 family phage major capsid protein
MSHDSDMKDITGLSKRAIADEIQANWHEYKALAERAAREEHYAGGALPETALALSALSERMLVLGKKLDAGDRPVKADTGQFIQNGETYRYPRNTSEGIRFEKFLRKGIPAGAEHDAEYLRMKQTGNDWKAMTLNNGPTGGFLASDEFSNDVLAELVDACPIRNIVTVATTGASEFIQPVRSDLPAAKRVSETTDRVAGTDMKFDSHQFIPGEMMASVLASRWVVDDSQYDLGAAIANAAAAQFALLESAEFAKGSGVNGETLGLKYVTLPAANVKTATDTSGHGLNAVDLMVLAHESIKSVYARNARFLMTQKTLGKAMALRNASGGEFLFQPTISSGSFASILGIPVTICPDLPEIDTAGLDVCYFGDFRTSFLLVDRVQLAVQRLTEPFAHTGQIEFIVYRRSVGGVIIPDGIARMVAG